MVPVTESVVVSPVVVSSSAVVVWVVEYAEKITKFEYVVISYALNETLEYNYLVRT